MIGTKFALKYSAAGQKKAFSNSICVNLNVRIKINCNNMHQIGLNMHQIDLNETIFHRSLQHLINLISTSFFASM